MDLNSRNPLALHPQKLRDLGLVESDDNIIIDRDHWHAHLSRHLYHFSAFVRIDSNVVLVIRDIVLLKEFFRHSAISARWGGINRYFFHRYYFYDF